MHSNITDVDCEKLFDVSLIVALIAIVFDSTYVDQDDLPVVTSGTSRYSGSSLYAESSWDRVALTILTCARLILHGFKDNLPEFTTSQE